MYLEISQIHNIVGGLNEIEFIEWLQLDEYCNHSFLNKTTLLAVYEELKKDGTMLEKEIFILKTLSKL